MRGFSYSPHGVSESSVWRAWARPSRERHLKTAWPGWWVRTIAVLRLGHHRQHQVRWPRRRAVDALRGLDEIGRRRSIDARYKLLRIAVDEREPGRLYLNHQAVPLEKHVVAVAQRDLPLYGRVGGEGLRVLVAREVATAAHLHRDRQLVAVHRARVLVRRGASVGIPRVRLRVFRVHVDQLHHKVGIAAGGGCEQIGRYLSGDRQGVLERCAREGEDVGPLIDEPLILDL